MHETNDDKTGIYGSSESDKTGLYGGNNNPQSTQAYGTPSDGTTAYGTSSDETLAYGDSQKTEFKSQTHGLGIGDTLKLRDRDFTITAIISEGTGEAVIYKIEDTDKNVFVLKLYFEFSNPKEEPNGETLKRIKDISDPIILKLYDFGVGTDKYQGKYCFEISEFAEGGDLLSVSDLKEKYTPDFLEQKLVPQVLQGIKKLHEYKIYHCDLKPSNVFFKDKAQTQLLIGDYGSAKAYDLEMEKDLRKSSMVKGTDSYLPPEQAMGMISEKNDYYSLGMVLVHLLYPDQLTHNNNFRQIDREKFGLLATRQINSKSIVDYDSKYARLNNLIAGLTLNFTVRFSKMEVDKWLNGEEVEVQYKEAATGTVQFIKLGYATIKTEKDLLDVLETQATWYEDLIEDPDTFSTFKNWMDSYRDIPARKELDRLVGFYRPHGKEYVKEVVTRFFRPQTAIKIESNNFNFFESQNLKTDVEAYIKKLDAIWKKAGLNITRFYLTLLELQLRQIKKAATQESTIVVDTLIDKIYAVFNLAGNLATEDRPLLANKLSSKDEPAAFRFILNLFYAFSPDRVFIDLKNDPIPTLAEVGLFYIADESAFNNKFLIAERERFLHKANQPSLIPLGYKPFIFEIFKQESEAWVDLNQLSFDKYRAYTVEYKCSKSLNTFLRKRGINQEFVVVSDQIERYETKRAFFQPFKVIGENFIASVTNKHNIQKLSEENLDQIRKKFVQDSWKRYKHIHSGQFAAFLVSLPLIFAYFGISTHLLRVDNNWAVSWHSGGGPGSVTMSSVVKGTFHKTLTATQIKSEASANGGAIVRTLAAGEMLKVVERGLLDEKKQEWFKVYYNGSPGYILANSIGEALYNLDFAEIINIKPEHLIGDWQIISSLHMGTGQNEPESYGHIYQFSENGEGAFRFTENGEEKSKPFRWEISSTHSIICKFAKEEWVWQINYVNGNQIFVSNEKYKYARTLAKN